MLESIVTCLLLLYFLIFQLPKLIGWFRYAKYTDDSFYEKQEKPSGPADYL